MIPCCQSPAILTCWSHLPSLDIRLVPPPDHQGLFQSSQGFHPSGSPWRKFSSSWVCVAYALRCKVQKVSWVVSEHLHRKWDSSFLVSLLVPYHQRPLSISLKSMLSPISPLNEASNLCWTNSAFLGNEQDAWKWPSWPHRKQNPVIL